MIQRTLNPSKDDLAGFCRHWQVSELSLFGSALRADFRADSDVDVLVSFAPGVSRSLHELLDMKEDLERLFGRRVDLVQRRLVERSPNYLRRQAILEGAKPLLQSCPRRTGLRNATGQTLSSAPRFRSRRCPGSARR